MFTKSQSTVSNDLRTAFERRRSKLSNDVLRLRSKVQDIHDRRTQQLPNDRSRMWSSEGHLDTGKYILATSRSASGQAELSRTG